MKKTVFAFVSFVLMLTVMLSSFAMFSSTAEETNEEYVFSEETPFIRYQDEKGIRYIGATGNNTAESGNAQAVSDAAESSEVSEIVRDKGELAAVGNSAPLPDSVDLGSSKYFPPIGNQGGLGSCATFSTAYYQLSYEMNRQLDRTATLANTRSPQLVYNLMSTEGLSGTLADSNYKFMMLHGAPSMELLPYSDSDHYSWYASEEIWKDAMDYRVKDFHAFEAIGTEDTQITSPDDEDLYEVKAALASGQVLIYATCIYSWVGTKIEAHPDAPENAKFEGQEIIKYQDGTNGGHSMTLVGYNDNLWVDQNSNGKVDEGEMGALKIANSWGDGYANDGFCWVAYDALNKVTSVEGGYSGYRERPIDYIQSITVKPADVGSKIYARFTLNTADRSQMDVYFNAEHNGIEETQKFLAAAPYKNVGNDFGFYGTKEATDGTFCFALDNVSPELCEDNFEDYSFSATFEDLSEDGIALEVKKLEIVNEYTGEVYTADNAPLRVDGEKVTVEINESTTDDKIIYYIGFDEPTLHYKVGDSVYKSVKMEYTEDRLGHNYRYVMEDTPEDITLYFTDENSNVDNNGGKNYVATERLNFYRTVSAREPLEVLGCGFTNGTPDIGKRSYFAPVASGGFEPYVFQYTLENLETGEIKQYPFETTLDKSHAFYAEGKFNFTVEVRDQSGDIASYTTVVDVVNMSFVFKTLSASANKGGSLFVGDEIEFYAETDFEDIISRGPFQSQYEFVIKDTQGKVCYTETVESRSNHLGDCKSYIYLYWIPEKKGNYTVTVSSTDDNKEYAEKTAEFTVFDKFYGDANGDGEVNVKDATAIQKSLSGIEFEGVFRRDLADCDTNEVLSIKDATCIRKYLANVPNAGKAGTFVTASSSGTEPETKPQTEPVTEPKPVTKNTVTFTNSFNWSGTISCYYWSDSNKNMTTWPGKAMTNAGTNTFGETLYTFDVPNGATYIIFTNGSAQTVDIPYSGGEVKFYPLSETDSQGHYKVANW